MILCGEPIEPGQRKKVLLPVPGADPFPAALFCGRKPGKTLVVTAGVHGCEYVGVETLRRLTEELSPETLTGNVVLAPLMNAGGFYAGAKQIVPADGQNLNRAFPGKASGGLSARLAAAVEAVLYPAANFLADLHGGDVNENLNPLVFFPVCGEAEVCRKALAAARELTVPYRVRSTAKNGLYSWAVQKGIPAVLIERGGQGLWSEEEVSACREDVFALMRHLEILSGENPARSQREIAETVYEEAPSEGLWYPSSLALGKRVRRGETLGALKKLSGETVKEVYAAFDGVVLYYTTALGVCGGDPLVAYGRI